MPRKTPSPSPAIEEKTGGPMHSPNAKENRSYTGDLWMGSGNRPASRPPPGNIGLRANPAKGGGPAYTAKNKVADRP